MAALNVIVLHQLPIARHRRRGPKHATSTENDSVEAAQTPTTTPIHARMGFGTGRGSKTLKGVVLRQERLGGILIHYYRQAA